MKKFLLKALGCLLLCAMIPTAQANEWGLTGGIYDIVSDNDRYDGYSTPSAAADDGNSWDGAHHVNHAILQNRGHALLIAAWRDDKVWTEEVVSTTAVYQPGDERGEYPNAPALEHIPGGFVLSYGDKEFYTFHHEEGSYVLADVRWKQDAQYVSCYVREESGLQFWQSNPGGRFLPIGDALWQTEITLEEFNIAQTPRSLTEMRQLTMVSDALMEAPVMEVTGEWPGAKDAGKLAVYSAPDASSCRAAEGKASVSLGDKVRIYGTQDGWTLIGYEVSPRTSRIGYVQKELGEEPLAFAAIPLTAAADTFLTDDPFVSQYAQTAIPKGAALTGLSRCGEYYAYVEYKADKLYRGFVPLKDLITTYDRALTTGSDLLTADVRWDVVEGLCGKWFREDWASEAVSERPELILFSNGGFRYRVGLQVQEEGNYRVYDAKDGGLRLFLRTEDNRESTCTLTLNEDGTISLDGQVLHREEYSTYGNG